MSNAGSLGCIGGGSGGSGLLGGGDLPLLLAGGVHLWFIKGYEILIRNSLIITL